MMSRCAPVVKNPSEIEECQKTLVVWITLPPIIMEVETGSLQD